MNNEHIPVFFELNDDLIEITTTAVASILYNTKSFIDFYFLDTGTHSLNKSLLEKLKEQFDNFSVEYIPIDLKQFKNLKGYTQKNFLDCYARLLIPELKPELDKAIYLDEDIIALDDIKKLWDEDLDGYEIALCPDLGYTQAIQQRCMSFGIPKNQIYCNAGVIIFDCKKWRENKVTKILLELAEGIKDKILYICEDLLNFYYRNNNLKILNLRYNIHQLENFIGSFCTEDITDEYIKHEWNKAVIQHLSPAKPWRIGEYNNEDLKHWSLFWFFCKMTPFFEGLSLKFLNNSNKTMLGVTLDFVCQKFIEANLACSSENNKVVRLFGFIPLLKIKQKQNVKRIYLLGFILLLKIKTK